MEYLTAPYVIEFQPGGVLINDVFLAHGTYVPMFKSDAVYLLPIQIIGPNGAFIDSLGLEMLAEDMDNVDYQDIAVLRTAWLAAIGTPGGPSGYSIYRNDALTEVPVEVKAGPTRLLGVYVRKVGEGDVWVKFWDSSAPVVGTDPAPFYVYCASGGVARVYAAAADVANFTTAMSVAAISALPDATTSPPTGTVEILLNYA